MNLINHIDDSIEWGNHEVSKLNQDVIDIHGITSNKVRCFLNNICSIGGTYLGSVFLEVLLSVRPYTKMIFTQ